MTPAYRVFIAAEVIALLRDRRSREKRLVTQLFEELAQNPFRTGDYVERDEVGRPIQVLIIGGLAVCFWADHAVKEVKVIDLKSAGR
jgi:hypothetical protein